MKKFSALMTAAFLVLPTFCLADANTAKGFVRSIETRSVGLHSLYVSVPIPPQGCTLSDRVVINENYVGGSTIFETALKALETGLPIVLRVSSQCLSIDGVSSPLNTAPAAIKLQIYSH